MMKRHLWRKTPCESSRRFCKRYAPLPQARRSPGGWMKHGWPVHHCAISIRRYEYPISRMWLRFGDLTISPNTQKVCAKPGCRSDQDGRSRRMKRREFLALAGAAMSWPAGVRAQQPDRMRRIGMLMNVADDAEGQASVAAFKQAMEQLGWADGQNVRIDTRWGANDVDRDRRYATELAASSPDVIVAAGTLSVAALQRVTR